MDGLTCRACHGTVAADDPLCPNCDANLIAPGAVLPVSRAGRLAPMAVNVTLDGSAWRWLLTAGGSLALGRDPSWSPAAEALSAYDNVSRRHAELHADAAGQISVTDLDSLNGTYVDGERLPSGRPVSVRVGAALRLGSNVTLLLAPSDRPVSTVDG